MDITDRFSELTDTPPPYTFAPLTSGSITRLDEIAPEPLDWVWPGWIPAGTLTLLGGHVGDGKSTIAVALIAALTSGQPLPDGTTTAPVSVLILSTEDDPARVIRPRLDAHNADPTRIYIIEIPDATTATRRTWPDNKREIDLLRTIIEVYAIRLIVIDPLAGILPRADRAGEGDVRETLRPLMEVLLDTGVALLGVTRTGKSASRRRPAHNLIGSTVIPSLARSVLMLARDRTADTAPTTRVLEVVKSNYADLPAPVALAVDATGVVQWLGPASATIDELAEMENDPRLSRTEREDAATFLRDLLANGPALATDILQRAKKAGFSEITIRRAKKDAGIASLRDPRSRGRWRWCLPGDEEKVRTRATINLEGITPERFAEEVRDIIDGMTLEERMETVGELIAEAEALRIKAAEARESTAGKEGADTHPLCTGN